MIAILCFALSLICYAISQLLQHNQFKWMSKDPLGFWGENMDDRKYKPGTKEPAYFLSTTWLVWTTDSYHMFQSLFFIFLSIGIALALEINFFYVWLLVLFLHWLTRRLLSK